MNRIQYHSKELLCLTAALMFILTGLALQGSAEPAVIDEDIPITMFEDPALTMDLDGAFAPYHGPGSDMNILVRIENIDSDLEPALEMNRGIQTTYRTSKGVETRYTSAYSQAKNLLTQKSGSVKQEVLLTNPTAQTREYCVHFSVSMDAQEIRYNGIDTEPFSGEIDTTAIILKSGAESICFDWQDLLVPFDHYGNRVELEPTAVLTAGETTTIDVSVKVELQPLTTMSLDPTYTLQTETDMRLHGTNAGDEAGSAFASGDINNDGYEDLIVGAPLADGPNLNREDAGEVYIIFGNRQNVLDSSMILAQDADCVIYGADKDDKIGSSLACGDIDNDGYDDIIIAAPYADGPENLRRSSGEVYIIWGDTKDNIGFQRDIYYEQIGVKVHGDFNYDYLGTSVAVGDMNNDGYSDILMGAPYADGPTDLRPGAGEVFLLYGDARVNIPSTVDLQTASSGFMVIYGSTDAENLGEITASGNIDGDTFDDIIIGTSKGSAGKGRGYIIYGSGSLPASKDLLSSSADKTISGVASDDMAFTAVASGDIDNDGQDDLVVSSPGSSGKADAKWQAGEVCLITGATITGLGASIDLSSSDSVVYGEDSNDRIGQSLAVGDSNGDGYEDVLIGSPYVDANNNQYYEGGEVYVVLGNELGNIPASMDIADVNFTYYGEDDWDNYGGAVAFANIDGDLKNDIVVGGPGCDGFDDTYEDAGCANLIFSGGEIDVTLYGPKNLGKMGYQVATGDINGDGIQDVVMTAPYEDKPGAVDAGAAYVWYGRDRTAIDDYYDILTDYDIHIIGYTEAVDDHTGIGLAIGNFNGDAYDDIALGVPNIYWPLGQTDPFGVDRPKAGGVMVFLGNNFPSPTEHDLNIDGVDFKVIGLKVTNMGHAVTAGDMDGDGFDELVCSAYKEDGMDSTRSKTGRCYIYYGRADFGTPAEVHDVDTDDYDTLIEGDVEQSYIGADLAMGNINGDDNSGTEKMDLLIGSTNLKYNGISRAGGVYVIEGDDYRSSTIDLRTDRDRLLTGAEGYDKLGCKIASEDVDNDGYDDILAGAFGGDGPFNLRKDSGEVYLVYGSSGFMTGADMSMKDEYDTIFYGREAGDWAGSALALGYLNNDAYADIIIGSPQSDGYAGEAVDSGLVSVIYGGTRSSVGTVRDLGSVPGIYGIDAYDSFGTALAAGDIDDDGRDDIVIGAVSADGPSNLRTSSGDVYMVYGRDLTFPTVNIDLFKLMDGGLTEPNALDNTKACFAGYKPYTFRMNITDIVGLNDVTGVEFHMDYQGKDIQFTWDRVTKAFAKNAASDPNNYVSLDPTTSFWNDTIDTWSLDLKVNFAWDYPDEDLTHCQVIVKTLGSGDVYFNYSNVYRVENDLDLSGEVLAYDEDGALLKENSWIRSLEPITWTNLSVVYENSDYNPPEGSFDIEVRDPQGRSWFNSTPDPKMINVVSIANQSQSPGELYEIKIANITGTGIDKSNVNYTLRIDAGLPTAPPYAQCHADSIDDPNTEMDNDKEVYFTWGYSTDSGGSGIEGYYAAYDNETPVELHKSGDKFIGGTGTTQRFYVRARDKAGNWGPASEANITIDTLPVIFENPSPNKSGWVNNSLVTAQITITDQGGGDIDASNVFYRMSLGGPANYYNWEYADVEGGPEQSKTVTVQKLFQEGENNFIKWKAQDIAGNGFVESDDYQIRIDSRDGSFSDPQPPFTTWNHGTNIKCSIRIEDTVSGVDGSSIYYRYSKEGIYRYSDWIHANYTGGGIVAIPEVEVEFAQGTNNFIQWKASDNAGNEFFSDNHQVNIDNEAPLIEAYAPNSSQMFETQYVECWITFTDSGGSSVDLSSVQYSTSTFDNWFTIGIGTEGYGSWKSSGIEFETKSLNRLVTATVNISWRDGDYNYIKWRAKDQAGNGYVVSPDIQIKTRLPVANNDPFPVITQPEYGVRKYVENKVLFDATGTYDLDGDDLEYHWESNLTGYLGRGKTMYSNLSAGVQKIYLYVNDGNVNISRYIVISVSHSPTSTDEDDDDTDDDVKPDDDDDVQINDPVMNNSAGILWQDIVMCILLLFVVVLFIWQFTVKPKEEPEDRETRKYYQYQRSRPKEPERFTCPNCDAEIPDLVDFCPVCGEVFGGAPKYEGEEPLPDEEEMDVEIGPAEDVIEETIKEAEAEGYNPIDGEADFDMDSFDDSDLDDIDYDDDLLEEFDDEEAEWDEDEVGW